MPRKHSSKPDAKIECDEQAVLLESKSKNRVSKVRVIKWIIDGKPGKSKIEKREFYTFQDGEPKMGKCVGFNGDEIKYIVDHWDEISCLF